MHGHTKASKSQNVGQSLKTGDDPIARKIGKSFAPIPHCQSSLFSYVAYGGENM